MYAKKLIECADCHEIFESSCSNSKRCPSCQAIYKHARAKERYEERKKLGLIKRESDGRHRAIINPDNLLNLPCPWWEGRLPESVTRNQVWG